MWWESDYNTLRSVKWKTKAFLPGLNTAICERTKHNVCKVLMSLRGTHDPTVRCQNAKGLSDSLELNCMFELISTVMPCYKWRLQPLFISVVLVILSRHCHSTLQHCGKVTQNANAQNYQKMLVSFY